MKEILKIKIIFTYYLLNKNMLEVSDKLKTREGLSFKLFNSLFMSLRFFGLSTRSVRPKSDLNYINCVSAIICFICVVLLFYQTLTHVAYNQKFNRSIKYFGGMTTAATCISTGF